MTLGQIVSGAGLVGAVCLGYTAVVQVDVRAQAARAEAHSKNPKAHAATGERLMRLETQQADMQEDLTELKQDVKEVNQGVNKILRVVEDPRR